MYKFLLNLLIRETVGYYNLLKGESKEETNIQGSGMLERGKINEAGQYTQGNHLLHSPIIISFPWTRSFALLPSDFHNRVSYKTAQR